MPSRFFGNQKPSRPHLVRRRGQGVGGEVFDLRSDVESAFLQVQSEIDTWNVRNVGTSGPILSEDVILNVDTSSGPVDLTLPSETRHYLIKKVSEDTNVIRLVQNGSENIEGAALTFELPWSDGPNRTSWIVYSDGTDWWVVDAAGEFETAFFGRVRRVDQVLGSDVYGEVSGRAFATVEGALAGAQAGECLLIMPGTYSVPAGITVPAGVAIRGISRLLCTIQMAGVTADTTLVTMGEATRIEDLQIVLTSAQHHTLVGVLFEGGTASTAKIRSCQITVDNSTAPLGGSSSVYAVRSTGTGTPPEEIAAIRACNVRAVSIGGGDVRGILVDTNGHVFRARDTNFTATVVDGAGTAIGAEVNQAGAVLQLSWCRTDGQAPNGSPADVSETAGRLEINATNLINSNANGLGFTNVEKPAVFQFGNEGILPVGTRYLSPFGTGSTVEYQIQFQVTRLAKSLIVTAGTAPGAGQTTVVTVRLDTGSGPGDTLLALTLSDTDIAGANLNVSFTIPAGGKISVSATKSSGAATADVSAQVEIV